MKKFNKFTLGLLIILSSKLLVFLMCIVKFIRTMDYLYLVAGLPLIASCFTTFEIFNALSENRIRIPFFRNNPRINTLEDNLLYKGIPEMYEKEIRSYLNKITELSKNKKDHEKEINELYTEITRIEKEKNDELLKIKNDPNNKVIMLMIENINGTKDYFDISKSHIKVSFALSFISTIVGLFFIGFTIFLIFLKYDIQPILIASIGGVITEVFAATTFVIHNKSAKQLNRYYDALHENERFLSLLHIVTLMSEDKKDAAYTEIINNELIKMQNKKDNIQNKQDS